MRYVCPKGCEEDALRPDLEEVGSQTSMELTRYLAADFGLLRRASKEVDMKHTFVARKLVFGRRMGEETTVRYWMVGRTGPKEEGTERHWPNHCPKKSDVAQRPESGNNKRV